MPASQRDSHKYSNTTGVIFLFNLIVGTGALAMPGALQKSGLLIGIFLIFVLAIFSLITVTFIVEALAVANALSRKRYEGEIPTTEEEEAPLVVEQQCQDLNEQQSEVFEIIEKYEIGQIGALMCPKWCQILTYFCLCVYLYGDLAIYAAVIGKTGSHILCTYKENNSKADDTSESLPCWESQSLTRMNVYRLFVTGFILLLGPFVFFNLQKTKGLQILTVIMRWLAFFVMIIWSIHLLLTVGPQGHPVMADFEQMPTLFGVLVYSFMCQHSIPGLLQPIANKKHLNAIILLDYSLVAVFYISLCVTAVFTFKELEDLYTLNFWEITSNQKCFTFQRFLSYFLALFPIFTLSTSFPIIGITLRNNLRKLCVKNTQPVWYYDRLLFPLLTLIPPTLLALFVSNLHFLVGIVGSYAGAGVQYLIPCLLAHYARKAVKDIRGTNKYASPFRCTFWVYLVYIWMVLSLIFITINHTLMWT